MITQAAKRRKSDFLKLRTTQKGSKGEKLIEQYFLKRGYLPYKPPKKAHPIDFLFIHPETLKIFGVDAKNYPCRDYFGDNGCDYNDFKVYLKLSEIFPVYIAWIDEKRLSCYWLPVNNIAERLGTKEDGKIYWDLKCTKVLFSFTRSDIE